jgi:hypothetical protein
MPDGRAAQRYRKAYGRLLRLYPETFRDRFAEEMEQTFLDLCREHQTQGKGLFRFALGLFVETSAGIFRERTAEMMSSKKKLARIALITASILLLPLVAMQFSDEVTWGGADFVVAGVLLFASGLAFEWVAGKSAHFAYRFAAGLAVGGALLLIWMNLAVGLIGSEDSPANLMYLGVLFVGIIGMIAARFQSRGMARASFAMALAQALVVVTAFIAGKAQASATSVEVFLGANAVFIALWIGSAWLFRVDAARQPAARAEPT